MSRLSPIRASQVDALPSPSSDDDDDDEEEEASPPPPPRKKRKGDFIDEDLKLRMGVCTNLKDVAQMTAEVAALTQIITGLSGDQQIKDRNVNMLNLYLKNLIHEQKKKK